MFAVVDVETTGGHPSGHTMTEIGVVIHDGEKVVERFSSLLNPDQHIPIGIQTLTGITPDMVEDAPRFEEVAEKLQKLLSDHIFVAHNVNFDYGFVSSAFAKCGIQYNPKRLCTVRYSRRVEKGLPSYSLGNLCKHFDVKNEAAHRALGDADATAEILTLLLKKDVNEEWKSVVKKNAGEFYLPSNLPSQDYKNLPNAPGVYYFLGADGKAIYIGKATDLKKRVSSHFISQKETKRSQAFKREIYNIRFELTGSEFVASLLEDHEIRHYWPIYNSAQKKPKSRYGVFTYQNQTGITMMAINKVTRQQGFVKEFYAMHEAQAWVMLMVNKMKLNPAYCGFPFSIAEEEVSDETHVEGVEKLLTHLKKNQNDLVIKTKGRTDDEDGFVLVEGGKLSGIGFISHTENAHDLEDFLSQLRKLNSSVTSQGLVSKALESGKFQIRSF